MDIRDLTTLAMLGGDSNYFMPQRNSSETIAYDPVKLTGFTQVKGRRRLSKKKRKQLKTKKQ